MAVNRGKDFETCVYNAFKRVPNVSIDRLHDQTTGFKGSKNICDFIVYREPYEYYIECKSVHGDRLPFSNITDNQWKGLLEKSKIEGVFAGIMCWWVDKDTTAWLPIEMLEYLKTKGQKSVACYGDWLDLSGESPNWNWCWIVGKKKRVFFDYDMEGFLNAILMS